MSQQQRAEALERLGAAYRAALALTPAVGALDDPAALTYVDITISVLTRLYKHLEAQGEATEQSPPSS